MKPIYCCVCRHIITKNSGQLTNRGLAHKLCAWNRTYEKKMASRRRKVKN